MSHVYNNLMSNNRFCIYTIDKNTVDLLIEKHQLNILKEQRIKIRRLINPAKRIILAIVLLAIPHVDIVSSCLQEYNTQLVSSITCINADFNVK